MVAADIAMFAGFSAMWLKISSLCFNNFSCPDHLDPKNNNGKKTKTYYDYYGNYVSICHAVISMILCTIVFVTEGLTFGQPNSLATKIAIYNSFAYFVYDTIISEIHRYNTLAMSLHHVGALICTGVPCFTGANGCELAVSLIIAEVSNPFNLYREILRHKKQDGSKQYLQTSLSFACFFILSRFIAFPIVLAQMYPSQSHLALKMAIALVWFVSWHWLFVIFNFAVKELKVFTDNNEKRPNVSNVWTTIYALLSSLRKNRTFLLAFYAGSFWLSFGTLYLSHTRRE